jgi:carotenoid 1,2-hydratase
MSILSNFPSEKMWLKHRKKCKRMDTYNTNGISSTFSWNWWSSLRKSNPRMDLSFSSALSTQQDFGSLPFGWKHSSGTGNSNGNNIRPIGGRGPDGGPRFGQVVDPGGYLWWYIDGTSEDGNNAISIIIFVGSVFSPYYALEKKLNSKEANPNNHCSFNVGIYNKKNKVWTMTEYGEKHISRNDTSYSVGNSQIEWKNNSVFLNIDEVSTPFPKRVKGTVKLVSEKYFLYSTWLDDAKKHRWGPIAPSSKIEVDFPDLGINWNGHGYMDSNEGDEALEVPFLGWNWARTSLEDGSALVFYDVKQKVGRERVLPLRFFPNGEIKRIPPPPREDLPDTAWFMSRFMRAEPARPAHIIRSLEDTPFYSRCLLSAGLLGDRHLILHETLNLKRFSSFITKMMLPWRMPRID